MKLYLWPGPENIELNSGIGRIVHAQYKYLPQYGIEFVTDPNQADLRATHTQKAKTVFPDVLHLHGMYWTGEAHSGKYDPWHWTINREIIAAARGARAITVPSHWCARVFQRDMRLQPHVIGHGLDFEEWTPAEPKGYVLWNKNRNVDVCDPTPAVELAKRGARVVSTFVPSGTKPPERLTVVGALPHEQMKELVRHAEVYLATVKETYGIGTLEALACGVPVVGFRHGGTAEIIEQGVTGYLAEPGDYAELFEGLAYCLAHREEIGAAGREFARSRDWSLVMGAYAELYAHTLRDLGQEQHRVSIVITNYNYGRYVTEAVQSAQAQTLPCEVIVVDDGSTDDSLAVINSLPGIRLVAQSNQGVAAARNAGIRQATGDYIICLDADDRLDPRYAAVLRDALARDRAVGVAYTGLGLITPEGIRPNQGWPFPFKWKIQAQATNPPANCLPVAAMFRKSMWERSGGFTQHYAPGEDAEFWTRSLALGFTAQMVTDEPLFHYRLHGEGSASRTKKYMPIDTYLPWMRDQVYPLAAPLEEKSPPVLSYSQPKLTVIVDAAKVSPAQLARTLDSLYGQTVREWEALVMGCPNEWLVGHPYFHWQESSDWSRAARRAKAPLTYFLPAGGFLTPRALERLCQVYAERRGCYIYSDWWEVRGQERVPQSALDYDQERMFKEQLHPLALLIDTEAARQFYAPKDFLLSLARQGHCGYRLPERLVVLPPQKLSAKWGRNAKGDLMACGCGEGGEAVLAAKAAAFGNWSDMPKAEMEMGSQAPPVVRMEFVGTAQGATSYGGPGIVPSGKRYRASIQPHHKFHDVDPRDVPWLENTRLFKVVPLPKVEVKLVSPDSDPVGQEEALDRIIAEGTENAAVRQAAGPARVRKSRHVSSQPGPDAGSGTV